MDREPLRLCESLMKWLQTFNVEAPHDTVEELSDGVAMAQVLVQIAPEWFNNEWMAKINKGAGSNKHLKVSNLRKVIKGLLDYQENLGQHITDFIPPDATKIGEKSDPAEMGRLLQLILGCAVNCDNKQGYIKTIMGMEESVQQVIMQAIQELMTKEGSPAPVGGDIDMQLKHVIQELERCSEARDQMTQRCHELDIQVRFLLEEKGSLQKENKELQERLRECEIHEVPASGTGQRNKELKKQLERLKEDNYKLENSRDDYRSKVETLEKELLDLQAKQEDLLVQASEARQLKDEVDFLRETADKARKYESTIESYKKKLEDFSDLKRQMKILEERNTEYMQQVMDLEAEIKRSGTWKPQIEMYKKQVAELHQKLSEESKKADKAEFENKKLHEKLQAVQREKEALQEANQCLIRDRDNLKETNEELKCRIQIPFGDSSGMTVESAKPSDAIPETESVEMIPPKIKEKLLKLQHENKKLKENQRSPDDEQVPVLLTVIDDLTQRENELRTENRLANQRILELESQVEELQERLGAGDRTAVGTEGSGVRQRLAELQGQVGVLQTERDRKATQLEEKEASLADYKMKIESLQVELNTKESEIQAMEERYKKYIEKAKSVIKTLDPKQNPSAAAEVTVLRNKLIEKEKYIETLEKESEKDKAIRDTEEKLMVSAFYKFGLQLHRQAVEQRLAQLSTGQSFLSRQRQATSRRTGGGYNSRLSQQRKAQQFEDMKVI